MDIENMHPFCLPFSLCHDATSTHDDDMFCKDKNGNSSSSSSNNNNNNNNIGNEKERSRLKGLTSPIDDLFDCLDRSISSPSSRLLLHGNGSEDDCIIDSSDPYHALRLDIEMVTDLGDHHQSESKIEHEFGLDHNSEDIDSGDDWFTTATHDCLLFSPSDGITAKHRKSLKGVYYSNLNNNHHHQVFHVVDPIDIKSSPTLAQLNLNSNDDPTDSLWDTTTTTSTSTTSTATSGSSTALIASTNAQLSHSNHNLSSDLSTSRTNSLSINGCLGSLTTCNHLNHQHSTYTGTPLLHHHNQNGNSHVAASHHHHHHTCNQLYHHHHHHPKSGGQSTCLAVTPFRKSGPISGLNSPRGTTQQNQAHFCTSQHNHHSQTTSNSNINNNHQHSQTYRNPNNQGLCSHNQRVQSNLNNSNDQRPPQQQQQQQQQQQHPNNLTPADDQYHRQQQQQNQQCSSPAPLVTSSSSPLLTSAPTNQTTPLGNDNRLTDNKLKENIEYLTVLLCNGNNKLENKQSNLQQQHQQQQQQQQQSSISSTMIKSSYSTLAQSLSTEPKLLQYNNNNHRQAPTSLALNDHSSQHTNMRAVSTNEASPHCASMPQIDQSSVVSGNHQTIGCPRKSDEWFRSTTAAVESSISAADSTAENQLTTPSTDHISRSGACLNFNNQHTGNNLMCSDLNQASRQSGGAGGGEMKVLSSLLNSNTCRGIAAPASQTPTAMFASNTTNWQQNNNYQQHVIHEPGMMYAGASNVQQMPAVAFNNNNNNNNNLSQESNGSIPPNGRPITLTPLVSNNVIIPQRQVPPQIQQQQAALSKANNNKAPTFAQPASPSASSTTSSSGNAAEINSTNSTIVKIRPTTKAASQNNSSQQQQLKQSTSERSGRPNSLSTDCSLSSHDEGFSSQMDQDDSCVNDSLRGDDSDEDESDVDSDDESFYGDYSNSDLIGASISDNPDCKWTLTMGRTRRNGQRRFFWQYNVQSKGPKGTRISSADGSENPFVLPEASDPVFSNDCQIEGVKHSGKARRGDGNDLTPNPKKLLMIGLELKKLSKIINELAPVTDLPLNARNKTRKEKNKLASRACRLKKKAQHEANKIKLYGLQREHQQVVEAIYDIRKIIRESLSPDETMQKAQQLLKDRNLSNYVKTLIDQCSMSVAGKTSDYVNSVLEKVVSGFIDGGLQVP